MRYGFESRIKMKRNCYKYERYIDFIREICYNINIDFFYYTNRRHPSKIGVSLCSMCFTQISLINLTEARNEKQKVTVYKYAMCFNACFLCVCVFRM